MNTTSLEKLSAHALTALNLAVAAGAITGGVGLLIGGEGPWALPLSVLEGTPFSSFLIPGILLGGVVGGIALAAAISHLRRRPWAALVSEVAGATLVGWIGIQMLMLGHLSWLQPLMLAVGLAQLGLAAWLWSRRVAPDLPVAHRAHAFLSYKRLAFVGLSTNPQSFSRSVARELMARGFQVVPVNPTAAEIDGMPCWPTLSAIPDAPRAALVMVSPDRALGVVEDGLATGIEAIWFHRGAGAEGSGDPAAIQRALDADLLVVDGVCPMMYLSQVGWFHFAHRWMREQELSQAQGGPPDPGDVPRRTHFAVSRRAAS